MAESENLVQYDEILEGGLVYIRDDDGDGIELNSHRVEQLIPELTRILPLMKKWDRRFVEQRAKDLKANIAALEKELKKHEEYLAKEENRDNIAEKG